MQRIKSEKQQRRKKRRKMNRKLYAGAQMKNGELVVGWKINPICGLDLFASNWIWCEWIFKPGKKGSLHLLLKRDT